MMGLRYEVLSAVTGAAAAYDLTTLSTVHDELELPTTDTSKDAFLGRAITQASATIANYCNRVFVVETLSDTLFLRRTPQGRAVPLGQSDVLQLSRWPIVNYGYFALTGNLNGTTTIANPSSTAGLTVGMPVFGAGIPAGATLATVTPSLTLSVAATATANGVALTTGINVVETQSSGATPTTLIPGTDFLIRPQTGELIRLDSTTLLPVHWVAVEVVVQYSAGYSAIPADIVDATLRLVTARFKGRGRDPMLRSEGEPGIGQTQYWVGTVPGQSGALSPEIASLLDNYRVPVFG